MSTKRTSSLTNRAVPILAYHDFESTSWKYALDPSRFDEHLSYLQSKGYVVINLADYNQSTGLALSTKSLILTFNGAFKSIETVLPVLQKYKARPTIFVSSAYVGKKASWRNMPNNAMTLLDWEALRNLSSMGFEIASHGHEHLQLDLAPEVLARHDISYSKVILEDNLGKPCLSFAYPYGYYNTQVRDLVRSAGFSVACTLDEGVSTSDSDPFTLPRLTITSGLDASRLKHLIIYKDSGQVNPYSFVKASISRQLRRWKTPLKESQLHIYDEALLPDVKLSPLQTPPSPEPAEKTLEQPVSVPKPDENQIQLSRQGPEVLNLPNENPAVSEYQSPQETLPTKVLAEETALQNETEQSREFALQGEFLASCKAKLSAYPYQTLEEYQHLMCATEDLQKAQENFLLFENFEVLQNIHTAFTHAVTQQISQQQKTQKAQLHQHLSDLEALSDTPLQSSVERIKHILTTYIAQLEHGLLQPHEMHSLQSLILNLKQRLETSYRRQLLILVQQASKHNASEVLKDIQHATRLLEQHHYPDLKQLKQSLKEKISQDKRVQQRKRKSEQFTGKLQELQMLFAPLAHLNNENVYTLSSILQHLEKQQANFYQVSDAMQQELIHNLKEARYILSQLQKEQQTAMQIAVHILSQDSFNDIFKQSEDNLPALPQVTDLHDKHTSNLN